MSQTKIFADQITDSMTVITGATGTVTHNMRLGSIFYHKSIAGNFTANITNIPTTNDRAFVVVMVLVQGATAYIPSAAQIDGSSVSISWVGGSAPAGGANKTDVVSFTLLRESDAWKVLGQLGTFG